VTGARTVAVTRYGSYEAKVHGRNTMGTIKQGDYERIGGHGDYRKEQGVSADGSNVKKVNSQVASQSHEYAADGQTIVDDGSTEYQAKLTYDSKAAAQASPYNVNKQQSVENKPPNDGSSTSPSVPTVASPSPMKGTGAPFGHDDPDRHRRGPVYSDQEASLYAAQRRNSVDRRRTMRKSAGTAIGATSPPPSMPHTPPMNARAPPPPPPPSTAPQSMGSPARAGARPSISPLLLEAQRRQGGMQKEPRPSAR